MGSNQGQSGWYRHSIAFAAALLVAGLQFLSTSAFAMYELPPGERITNLPHIPRALPQKEAYEVYDPVIGRNFDIKNLWLRADLRVRPEMRNGVCFGGGAPVGGACNSFTGGQATRAIAGKGANDFFVQQWARLGIGYDLSPDVNFYMEIIDSANWGSNGNPNNAGNGGDPLIHSCGNTSPTGAGANCRLGVRAAYMLVRNLAGVQGLSMKAGRQYVIFGNHSIFGHFDWANTGYSHDGIMFNYNYGGSKHLESWLGWFRNAETDLAQGAPVGSLSGNVAGLNAGPAPRAGTPDGGGDADMFIFYNQIKSVPGFLIEPYYVLYMNQLSENSNTIQGMGTPKKANQIRHMLANRIEMRKGNWDFINETAYQFGKMADGICAGPGGICDNQRNITINAWATRNWLGYTMYESKLKPRLAIGVDYASGDGRANCATGGTNALPAGGAATPNFACSTGNTFENFFPTNHIHMGYMDVQAWKNMFSPQANFQIRPATADHFEIWYSHLRLANARDNWYRAAQGAYIFSRTDNTKNHIGDEIDVTWTHMFADGKVSLQVAWGTLFTGAYISENLGMSSNQHWGFVQLWMNF